MHASKIVAENSNHSLRSGFSRLCMRQLVTSSIIAGNAGNQYLGCTPYTVRSPTGVQIKYSATEMAISGTITATAIRIRARQLRTSTPGALHAITSRQTLKTRAAP